ncbi:MAG: twin-arginine translocation signal domain-containing protein [Pseudomonadota bacterium]
MKRQKQKPKRNRQRKATAAPQPAAPQAAATRRGFLKRAGTFGVIAVGLGGVGWYFVEDVRATVREEDLSRIGQGVATVVQIHDPQCPRCTALQRQARRAMEAFDAGELQYLVANITSDKGRRLANHHNVGTVTLLLFGPNGDLRNILVGTRESEELVSAFRRIIPRSS